MKTNKLFSDKKTFFLSLLLTLIISSILYFIMKDQMIKGNMLIDTSANVITIISGFVLLTEAWIVIAIAYRILFQCKWIEILILILNPITLFVGVIFTIGVSLACEQLASYVVIQCMTPS